ncbi:MAG: MBL fold metallo-hydrolase, partial [Candidatus Aenigmarchaeota archaeon]|nr:MBL fold metallo-hydrolase [Candidatus Aenigmarchaeota archaeon]
KILVEDRKTKVFLDFGTSFGKIKKFYKDPFSSPRSLLDRLVMGILPDLEGVYNPVMLRKIGRKPHQEPLINACILSHSHLDHFGDLGFLDPTIPIYCSRETYCAIKAYEDVTRSSEEKQWTYHQESRELDDWIPIGYYWIDEEGKAHKATKEKATHERVILQFEIPPEKIEKNFVQKQKFGIDNLEVELFPVDHSSFDAKASIIYTSDAKIAYTGDIRFHGFKTQESVNFVEEAKNADILIVEGTKINEEVTFTEYDVEERTKEIVRNSKGLVLVDFSLRNLEEFLIYKRIAEETGRNFVTSPKNALFLLYKDMKKIIKENFSNFLSKILVFDKNISSTRSRRSISKYKEIEVVKDEEIRKNPQNFMINLSFYEFDKLVDFSPPEGSVLIVNNPEPFDEESILDEERIYNWCNYFKLKYYRIHASGHLGNSDFLWMVKEIKPKYILPIHSTLNNALLIKERFGQAVRILKEGETFNFKPGLLNFF